MALYDEFTTPAKVNSQIDAILNGQKGTPNGLVQLNSEGKIDPTQLPPATEYRGIAVPSTVPSVSDLENSAKWDTLTAGTYPNMGGIVISSGDIADGRQIQIVYTKETASWSKQFVGQNLGGYLQTSEFPTKINETDPKEYPFVINSSPNLLDNTVYSEGFFGTTGNVPVANASYRTSDFISVVVGDEYKKANSGIPAGYIYWYNASKEPFSVSSAFFAQYSDHISITIPSGVFFVRIVYLVTNTPTVMFGLSISDFSTYVPYNQYGFQEEYFENSVTPFTKNSEFQTKLDDGITDVPDSSFNFMENQIIPASTNLLDNTDYIEGFLGTSGNTPTANPLYRTSGFIPVTSGLDYTKINATGGGYVYWYNSLMQPFAVSGTFYSAQSNGVAITIPAGVFFVRVIFPPANTETVMFGLFASDFSSYVPYSPEIVESKIKESYLPDSYTPQEGTEIIDFGFSDLGVLDYQEIESDYSHIILYGQSLSQGYQSPRALTTTPIVGNFMVGTAPYYYGANLAGTELNPLVSVQAGNLGENPIVPLVNSFSKLYRRFVNKNQKFIGSNPSQDGRSIEKLSKECTNGTTAPNNLYNQRYIKLLDDTKSIIDGLTETVSCPVIIYMQGEYNYTSLTGNGLTAGTDATTDKATYKALLLTLKNNMQEDVMSIYGQTKKPLFFIYQTTGSYVNNISMSITQAQVEFARENEDVFLLNPPYFCPDYSAGHLSTNGYRWYGEMMAKSLYNVLVKGENKTTITKEKVDVNTNSVIIHLKTPVLPLVFDTYTTPSQANYGFRLRKNSTDVVISSVEIFENQIILNTATDLIGTIEVIYAGQGRNGSGNVRDSDSFLSQYTYFNDVGDTPFETYTAKDSLGTNLYGKRYPMYNWLVPFYHSEVIS